ncbi:hypothetical protein [uncultured Eubacterium sp.]|uniref:Ger(x)C family spore germination protein n=1 Tax=uncultured Eubacterium sp. TaxID=165185 RepID=UPI0025D53E53|nr:hypothetical protein [uncultured Eubacterium sp.]
MKQKVDQKIDSEYQKMRIILCALCWTIFVFCLACLGGCGVNELENQAFPLALGVEAQHDGAMKLYLAYPNLQDEKASENALSSDVFWEGEVSDLFTGMRKMSENSNKNPDLNHLKVLILNPRVFASEDAAEAVLSFFEKETDAAWNTYVLLAEGPMDQLFSEDMQLPECMGIYLEDLLEEWKHVKDNAFVTVGTLMQQFYGVEEMMCIPKLELQDEKLNIGGFAVLHRMKIAGNLSLQEGYDALLLQNKMREYQFQMKDGTGVTVEQLRIEKKDAEQRDRLQNDEEKEVQRDDTKNETQNTVKKITVQGSFGITNRMEGSRKTQKLEAQAKRELETKLQSFAEKWQQMIGEETESVQVVVE